jgi:hypothetical protein
MLNLLTRLVILRVDILKPRIFGIKHVCLALCWFCNVGFFMHRFAAVVFVLLSLGQTWWLGDRKILVLLALHPSLFMHAIKFLARRDVPLALKCRPDALKTVLLILLC